VPQNGVTNRPYSGCNVVLLWLARNRGWSTPRFLTFKQAAEAGGHVRKGEHGTKVYFVKQLQVKDDDETRVVPMLREYTVFNLEQCEDLPESIKRGRPMRLRNPDTRDALADQFLHSTRADIREGHGEAYLHEEAHHQADLCRGDAERGTVAVRAGRLMSMPKDGRATRKLIRKVKAIEAGGICTSRISYGWAIQRAQNAPKSTIGIEHPGWRRSTMMTRDAAQSIGAR
jgi:antirestriction protein ArdC